MYAGSCSIMESDTDVTEIQLLPVQDMTIQIVNGHILRHLSDDNHIEIIIDPSQHSYSVPLQQVIIKTGDNEQHEVLGANSHHEQNDVDDDSDTDVNDKVMSASVLNYMKQENITADFIPDCLTQSISHHDYISSSPFIQREHKVFNDNDTSLVIEEAVEQEISTTSQSLEDEEIVRSKPLTAMYLQRKEVGIGDTEYIPNHRSTTTMKASDSSRFMLKSLSRSIDIGYDELSSYQVDDIYRIKNSYTCSEPISVYHPNTGEIHFKMEPDSDTEKRSPCSKRSVEAILAASETIKNQDIASEVEVGTCEIAAGPIKRGRKKKDKKSGIDDDIEQIRKAAKDVACTLKGLNNKKDGRKRKKPRIRLTLTKAKGRQLANMYSDEDSEYENSSSSPRGKRGRKRKADVAHNIIYQCEYCEKQFKTREKVRVHTKIHTEDRAFNCDICGSQYRRREHLIRHYRRHTNDRPYQCLECGKSYMRAEHLKRHSYDHTGEKPFECPICPKAFTRHDRLIKHSLVHDK